MDMTPEQRSELVEFCIEARAEIEGIEDRTSLTELENATLAMTDEELLQEADFLDDMLGK